MDDAKFYAVMDSLGQIDEILTGRNILTSYTYAARQEIGDEQYKQAEHSLELLREELSTALAHTLVAISLVRNAEDDTEENE